MLRYFQKQKLFFWWKRIVRNFFQLQQIFIKSFTFSDFFKPPTTIAYTGDIKGLHSCHRERKTRLIHIMLEKEYVYKIYYLLDFVTQRFLRKIAQETELPIYFVDKFNFHQ